MAKRSLTKYVAWIPNRPVSQGAVAYHQAVVNTSWHKENIQELLDGVKNKIKAGDIVVDFGAGTGSSALYLLKILPPSSTLLLVDNSPSWLGHAYQILGSNKQIVCMLLGKTGERYATLDQSLGENSVSCVVSANTVHLIPDIKEAFEGIYAALKNHGTFAFQSGNIIQAKRKKGILMIDDSIDQVHDLALDIVRSDKTFRRYKKDLAVRVKEQVHQRKFVFPTPRPIEYYLKILKSVGFKNAIVKTKPIRVNYADWLSFLRVRRLQAGILPEVGGKDATPQEEKDRDTIIKRAAQKLFDQLKSKNPFANAKSFTAEWIYVYAEKSI